MDNANYRVMVIDDQAFVRRIVTTMLRQMGFCQIAEAADGSQALQEMDRFTPHLVICDIEMRPMDGLDFLHMLRARKGGAVPKVIFLTCHGESEIVIRARDLGVDAFLLKPVTAEQLSRRIAHVFTS